MRINGGKRNLQVERRKDDGSQEALKEKEKKMKEGSKERTGKR